MSFDDSTTFGELPGVQLGTVHGLPAVQVSTQSASGLVYLQGAHVAAFQPRGQAPVIWMSENAVYTPGKALRGGVPICFPWFGAHDEYPEYPAHGFARTRNFSYGGARATPGGGAELELLLNSDSQTQSWFPFAFSARLRVAFGAALQLQFAVTNRDQRSFRFEEALHSYFSVSDVRQVSVSGLQGASYADKVQGMTRFIEHPPALRIVGETDRVYDSAASCSILDAQAGRVLRIEKAASGATVVWNPWAEKASRMADLGAGAWLRMLCVESANVGTSHIELAPGETHVLSVTVGVAPTAP